MNNFWRSIIAGYAGWKWGGGCLGFLVVFFIVFWLLGYVHCWCADKCWYFFSFFINEFTITAGREVTDLLSAVIFLSEKW